MWKKLRCQKEIRREWKIVPSVCRAFSPFPFKLIFIILRSETHWQEVIEAIFSFLSLGRTFAPSQSKTPNVDSTFFKMNFLHFHEVFYPRKRDTGYYHTHLVSPFISISVREQTLYLGTPLEVNLLEV